MVDIAIIGGGISGFTSALRLQHKGYKTMLLEAHGQIGGCAGFFKKKGFSFDVGATTLVDFVENGVGGNFFKEIDRPLISGDYLDYIAWLPDKKITLFRDKILWQKERLEKLGSTASHLAFWKLLDETAHVFWTATRKGIKLPIQNFKDILKNINSLGFKNLPYLQFLKRSMYDILKKFNLHHDKALVGLLSMLIEDTLHSNLKNAPFINAALGVSIRGASLMRPYGGMFGFWEKLASYYTEEKGILKKGHTVLSLKKENNHWKIKTNKDTFEAKKIICSLPISLVKKIAPSFINKQIDKYYHPEINEEGGAIVVFLGIPENEVNNQVLTHHQILLDYDLNLGNGNNMFISVSSPNDTKSAPKGFRSVMISTHCPLPPWNGLNSQEYNLKKEKIATFLLKNARKVYPKLGSSPVVFEIGTPSTYENFTKRPLGAVGGFKQTLKNSNQNAIPQNIGFNDFFLVGDSTWPGLGTVAGLVGSKIVCEEIIK